MENVPNFPIGRQKGHGRLRRNRSFGVRDEGATAFGAAITDPLLAAQATISMSSHGSQTESVFIDRCGALRREDVSSESEAAGGKGAGGTGAS